MRLMHPETMTIICRKMCDKEFGNSTVSRKQFLSHCWSEVLKYLATKQDHPKIFLNDYYLGIYMRLIMFENEHVKCNLNEQHLVKYDDVWYAYVNHDDVFSIKSILDNGCGFDNDYLFSDAVSLYFKGINIFPYIFGDGWRRYVPIENLKEIYRVVGKTLEKRSNLK